MTTTANASYGVHLNINPSATVKVVRLHALPCGHYQKNRATRKGTYTFNKNFTSLRSALDQASDWAREWNAPIKVCEFCASSGRFPA